MLNILKNNFNFHIRNRKRYIETSPRSRIRERSNCSTVCCKRDFTLYCAYSRNYSLPTDLLKYVPTQKGSEEQKIKMIRIMMILMIIVIMQPSPLCLISWHSVRIHAPVSIRSAKSCYKVAGPTEPPSLSPRRHTAPVLQKKSQEIGFLFPRFTPSTLLMRYIALALKDWIYFIMENICKINVYCHVSALVSFRQ